LGFDEARLTAAAVVTCIRVALELSTEHASAEPLAVTLGKALAYLHDGASL
jgi:hypothetical protein